MALPVRALLVPAVAFLVALATLLSLGTWQLQRRAWKLDLIEKIEARAYGAPGPILPEAEWPRWSAEAEEYRRVRLTGRFLHEHEVAVHGLMPGSLRGQPVQGFYILTPLRLADGSNVIVNRGFLPTHLRDPASRPESQPQGEVTVTGLVRSPEKHGSFRPENDPARDAWFVRDIRQIAEAKNLARTAPFLIDADDTPNPGGWPKGGQTRLTMTNDHLDYALTWYGLALVLVGAFGLVVWRHFHPAPGELVPSRPDA
ncbi:MAG TPA: SURF1 family protein [Beijerinckiaceae bacterium]|nr:SURF1 family protein [Beijerinckiaceae bacterium]